MARADFSARAPNAIASLSLREGDEALRREFLSIEGESDPQLQGEEMLALGARLESAGKASAAAQIYGAVPDGTSHRQAQERLGALVGQGSFGGRFEGLLRGFSRQATDPRLILPMLAGTVVYSLAKNFALARLAGASEAAWFNRGWGAQFIAATLGFSAEVPTFAVSARALGGGSASFQKDLLAATLSLGALKVFGAAGQSAARSLSDSARFASLASTIPAFTGYTGLLAAKRLEQAVGLRPKTDMASLLIESGADFLAMGVGAKLGDQLFGERWRAFQAEAELRLDLAKPAPRIAALEAREGARDSLASYLLPAPAPLMIFMGGTSFERLFRWLEKRLYDGEVKLDFDPENASAERMEGTLKVLLKRFPHLKKVFARSHWTLEEKWELMKAVTPKNESEPWEALRQLPKALIAMEGMSWSYEQQLNLLRMISRVGEFSIPLTKYLPAAIQVLRDLPWSSEQKYQLLYSLADRAGPNADRAYSNFPLAMKTLSEGHWDYPEIWDFLHVLCTAAEGKVGSVMSHLPAAFNYLREHEWTIPQQSRFILTLGAAAADDLQVSWMMEEHLPNVLAVMSDLEWNTAMQSRFLGRLLDRAGPQSSVGMEYLPGLMQTMRSFGWRGDYIYDTLSEIFDRARGESGKMVEMLPSMVQALRHKGLSIPTQREVLEEVAAHAEGVPKFSYVDFVLKLITRRLDHRPS